MLRRFCQLFAIGVSLAILTAVLPAHAQFTIQSFPGTYYNANEATMNANLGITGYTIERFNQLQLMPGVRVRFGGNISEVTYDTLPHLFDTSNFPPIDGFTSLQNNSWDDRFALTNGSENQPRFPAARDTTFLIVEGAISVGIGLANFQSAVSSAMNPFPQNDHELLINDVSYGIVEALCGQNWRAGIDVRNAYIRIDGTYSEPISSITFRNLNNGIDLLVFDHLAVYTGTYSVGGTIALQGVVNAQQSLDFTFRPTTGTPFTRTVHLGFSGGYNIPRIPIGTIPFPSRARSGCGRIFRSTPIPAM